LRKIESIEVFPVLLPMIETFQFASGSAGGGHGLKNVRDRPLIFGSPTTEGRPAAGYGDSSGGGRAPLAARYWPQRGWKDRR
jgi:hypothetical protein